MTNRDLHAELHKLLARIDLLAVRTQRLHDENRSLRQQIEQMSSERAHLLSKQEQARSRVEAMIGRLKSLEQHT
ncbi:TIGR02449 family protein [Thermomonas sp.]|jgi:cell division protein ZapB|uniref:TIGR02449 family protein n=1 Tax=Thermomonas sp. TaxID=1971895 RepID=UPI00238D6006|nr:TIGR02449 family protein [Thermomonas sp.]MBS0458596.1 TIGR02449 family protein [Pseudomonadota bacterium]MDE2381402.1 TIGR02449 family protein [Xanthomonadaceae bacterium]HOC11706.1 TIGR02449 family protein [Thermomonas sp.]HQA02621.1 TIGR02449 family protein [Thermomonas sp.]HQE08663.1 TIGR02449 family protein [Thermomonas sp.]